MYVNVLVCERTSVPAREPAPTKQRKPWGKILLPERNFWQAENRIDENGRVMGSLQQISGEERKPVPGTDPKDPATVMFVRFIVYDASTDKPPQFEWKPESTIAHLVNNSVRQNKGKIAETRQNVVTIHFPSPLLAISAARALQQKLQAKFQGPVAERIVAAVTISHLLQGDAGTAGQQDSPTAVIASSDRLKNAEPGQILLTEEIYSAAKDMPGAEFRATTSKDDTGAVSNTYELIWAEEHPLADPERNGDLNATFNSRYEILSELGHGAMGIVYKAQDLVIGRTVALKTIAVGHAADQVEVIERLKREAKAAGSLDHPNIITIYDVGHDGDRVYLSMQFVEGSTLAEVLAAKKLPNYSTLLGYADQICSALAFAHEQGVIHRDLKPSNLMLTPHGQIKVLDFGIAKQGDVSLTQSGMVVGTPSYMAPEQATGKEIDHRSDIFALGAVFYELFTGKKAFPAETVTAVLYEVVHQDPKPPTAINPMLPPGIDAAIRCALEKNPSLRFQSCTEMRNALRKEAALLKAGAPTTASKPQTQLDSGKHRRATSAKPKRRISLQVAIVTLFVLAMAAVIIWPNRTRMPRFMRMVSYVSQLKAKVIKTQPAPPPATPVSADAATGLPATAKTGIDASGAATSPSTVSSDATKADTTKADPLASGSTSGAVPPGSTQPATSATDHSAANPPSANQSGTNPSVGTQGNQTSASGVSPSAATTGTANAAAKDPKSDPKQSATSAAPTDDPATDPAATPDPPVTRKRPVAPPAPTVVEGFTRKDIPDLLRKAQAAAGSGDYSSARYEYDIVLKLDRQNAIAREGLRRAVAAAKEKL